MYENLPKKVMTCLWFENNANEAAELYSQIIPNTKILEHAKGPDGQHVATRISIAGTEYLLLNGGPTYKLSPATSVMMHCENQEEVDHLWDKLGEGGEYLHCGWLTDRFGLTWQITPKCWWEMITQSSPAQFEALWACMMNSRKLVVAELQSAFDSASP